MLVGALVVSGIAAEPPIPAGADSAPIATWDTQDDFESNASTTGEPIVHEGISSTGVPGSVRLADTMTSVSAGYYHTVRLLSDGTAVAVGDNSLGQCEVSGWTDLIALDAGGLHTAAVKQDGTAVATGLNDDGQCEVLGWNDLVAIAAADYHTVGLRSDGTVVAVGATTGFNAQGQLGVSGWSDIVAISAGRLHTVGLRSDGTVVAVGNNDGGRCDVGGWTDIEAISAGEYGTVGLKSDGTVVAVGYNGYGQFDVGEWTEIVAVSAGHTHTLGLKADGSVVAAGDDSFGQRAVAGWTDVVRLSAGGSHSVGVRRDGTIVSAGANDQGQRTLPADFIGIAAGDSHTVGLRSDGSVVAIGDNNYGKSEVASWGGVVGVDATDYNTVGVRSDGSVLAVGDNFFGQRDVSGWSDIVAVSANTYHTVGLKGDGSVVAAGSTNDGLCDVAGWSDIAEIAAGGTHTLGVRANGTVAATGRNEVGQIEVGDWSDVTAVAAGNSHSVGLKRDGTVMATGLNADGQCDVSTWTDIVAISANQYHTVGLRSDGTVVAAGYPHLGQLDVGGWTGIVDISAGRWHTVGLKSDGTVVAVGENDDGETNTAGWTSSVNASPRVGVLGGNGKVGLRADGGTGLSGWDTLRADVSPLRPGEAVKIGVRVSSDGENWSDPLGRDGQPVEWATGVGNYFGSACGDISWHGDLSRVPNARYVDLEVRLESWGVTTPELRSVSVTHRSNTAPEAVGDTYSTNEDTPLAVPAPGVLSNDTDRDGDDLIATVSDAPDHGTLSQRPDGSFSYAPDANWHGTDVFSYTASDGTLQSGATAVRITVKPTADPTVLATTATSKTLSKYGASYVFTGKLSSGGVALARKRVVLQTSSKSSGPFIDSALASVTSDSGTFSFKVTPRSKTYYRARFAGEADHYAAEVSPSRYATPRHFVTEPRAPKTVSRSKYYTIDGFLKPGHARGTKPVAIKCYKRNSAGVYKYHHTVFAKASDYSGYSKYKASVKLPHKGKWRLRAYAAGDANHAGHYSTYDYVTAK